MKFSSYKKQLCLQIGIPAAYEKEEYGQDLDFDGVDYDLNYTENTGYLIKRIMRQSKIQRRIGNIFIFQWNFLVGRIKGQNCFDKVIS